MKKPNILINPTDLDKGRFWKFVKKGDGCWIWTGGVSNRGYGKMGGGGMVQWKSHRVSWVIHNGSIPDGLNVLHECDNPSCVNPKHLFLGTQLDNVADAIKKGRFQITRKSGLRPNAKLTLAEVDYIRENTHQRKHTEMARCFGVSQQTISNIVYRKTWLPI